MRSLIISAVLAVGAMAVSCSKSGLETPPVPPRPNATPVGVSLATAPLETPAVMGRAAAGGTKAVGKGAITVEYGAPETKAASLTADEEQKVNDLWVIQFDKASGALVGQPYYATAEQIRPNPSTGKLEFEAKLTTASTPQIVCFVANTNSPSTFTAANCGTLADMENVCRRVGAEYKPTAAGGLPMRAVQEYPQIASGTPLTGAVLRRLVAKVVLRYKVSPDFAGFTLTGVRLRNVPTAIWYAAEKSGAVDFPAKNTVYGSESHFDYPAENLAQAVADGDYMTFTWYMPENLRQAVTTVSDERERTPDKTDGMATYVELTGDFKSPLGCERLAYRILLGDAQNDVNDYNVRRNRIYTATVTIEGRNATDKRIEVGTFDMNNSAMVAPNSKDAGAVTFDIRKLTKGWQTSMPALGTGAALRAQLLWTDNAALATQLNIGLDKVNGLLTVKSTGTAAGNAVVALYNSAAAGSGEVLWSWHIWVTDYRPDEAGTLTRAVNTVYPVSGGQVHTYGTEFQKTNGTARVIMDRNLGAAKTYSKAPAAGDATADQVYGLFYQWGRKDPFPGADGSTIKETTIHDATTIPIYGANGNTPLPEGEKDNTTAAGVKKVNISAAGSNPPATFNYAVKNPLTFIYNSSTEMGDWLTSTVGNQNNALWGDGGPKSAYDPCPEGWRVPKTGTWNDIGNDNFQYYLNGTAINNGATGNYYQTNGRLYIPAGTSVRIAWYPAGGLREPGSGRLTHGGSRGYSWSCTPNGDIKSKYVDFGMEGVGPQGQVFRAFGFPVRCIQE